MDALEKARLATRKYLSENKEKAALDLKEMRKASKGNDIFNYIKALSKSIFKHK